MTGPAPAGDPETVAEFTLKAVAAGVLLGIVFGAANAYLGLRVGMTVSASIPAAVLTVALFRLVGARASILEANLRSVDPGLLGLAGEAAALLAVALVCFFLFRAARSRVA